MVAEDAGVETTVAVVLGPEAWRKNGMRHSVDNGFCEEFGVTLLAEFRDPAVFCGTFATQPVFLLGTELDLLKFLSFDIIPGVVLILLGVVFEACRIFVGLMLLSSSDDDDDTGGDTTLIGDVDALLVAFFKDEFGDGDLSFVRRICTTQ